MDIFSLLLNKFHYEYNFPLRIQSNSPLQHSLLDKLIHRYIYLFPFQIIIYFLDMKYKNLNYYNYCTQKHISHIINNLKNSSLGIFLHNFHLKQIFLLYKYRILFHQSMIHNLLYKLYIFYFRLKRYYQDILEHILPNNNRSHICNLSTLWFFVLGWYLLGIFFLLDIYFCRRSCYFHIWYYSLPLRNLLDSGIDYLDNNHQFSKIIYMVQGICCKKHSNLQGPLYIPIF